MCILKCLLPSKICYDGSSSYNTYLEIIYKVFKRDFIDSSTVYKNAIVEIDHSPGILGHEKSFEHVTTKDYSKYRGTESPREPDPDRVEKVPWIKPFITEHSKCKTCKLNCEGIKVWEKRKKKNIRTLFLLEEERYLVVIEKKKNWYFLTTSYYVSYDHILDDLLDEFEEYKNSKNQITPP